eukprot:403360741
MANKAKSIYSKVKSTQFKPTVLPVLNHGDSGAEAIYQYCDRIVNSQSLKTKLITQSLKMTAAQHGLFSLSANQVNILQAIFTVHKHVPHGNWFHKNQTKEELNPEDYDIYINPLLLSETEQQEYAWEYCGSYHNLRCMVKRPLGIKVSYINGEGDEIEEQIMDHKARVFLHELDHINGMTMTHWRLSEGKIDIIDSDKENYKNLQSTIDYYSLKIDEMKRDFPEMFDQHRKKLEDQTDNQGTKWKKYPQETRAQQFVIENFKNQPSFEEAMMIDLIRSARKDTMAYMKKHGKDPNEQHAYIKRYYEQKAENIK